MTNLGRFLSYYGSKLRLAKHYPPPVYDHIVEPFAGSAGYSVRYANLAVTLYDSDPVLHGVWDFLIKSTPSEILALPIGQNHIDDYPTPCQEARWLIGFWLHPASSKPAKRVSTWASYPVAKYACWGEKVRARIANQVNDIKHWKVVNKQYSDADMHAATWFVDPPYQGKPGRTYRHNKIDYEHLAGWCKTLPGQVMVCENEGADWLPFTRFRDAPSNHNGGGSGVSKEVIWCNDTGRKKL